MRGFLRSYSNFLKLPADKIIADFNALHHAESRQNRTVNRESYGSMDISTSKEKDSDDATVGGTTPPVPGAAQAAQPAPRAQTTFVPPHLHGSPIDKKLLLKIGAGVLGLLVLILILVSLFSGRSATPPAGARDEVYVAAQPGEPTIIIAASGQPIEVKVTSTAQAGAPVIIYYHGMIPAGETRTLPRRGDLIVECARPENLLLTVGTWTGQLPVDPQTGRLRTSGLIKK